MFNNDHNIPVVLQSFTILGKSDIKLQGDSYLKGMTGFVW